MGMSDYYRQLRGTVGTDLLMIPAVAAVIHNENDRILMLRSHADGDWGLPAGAIEPSESPSKAIIREVVEETGVDVTPRRVLGVFGGENYRVIYPNGDQVEYTVIVFDCEILSGELQAVDGEALEFGWFDPASPPEMDVKYPSTVLEGDISGPYFDLPSDD